jgi:hypothetical protein
MKTSIRKNYRGNWEAETHIDMPELGVDKFLDITTTKRYSGNLVTTASVHTRDGYFVTHMMYQDFNTNYLTSGDRCTEKNVRKQHDLAIYQCLGAIKALAIAHYAKKAAA